MWLILLDVNIITQMVNKVFRFIIRVLQAIFTQMQMLSYIKKFFVSSVLMLSFVAVHAQNNIQQQATDMGKALIRRDYLSYVNFTHPKLLKEMGGKEKMAASIRQQMEQMEQKGTQVLDLKYGTPSSIVKQKDEFQCTIPQMMTLKIQQGKIMAKSTLIAISQDKGEHWFFVDAGDRDLATLRASLPNISKLLTLPTPEPPKFIQ